VTQNPGHPSPPFSHRRWLARVAIGSLLIPLTTASVIHTESPKAYGLSVADCSQTITLTDSTVVGPNDSYVATSTVDSDGDGTDDKCVLTFKRESVEMFWDTSEIAGDVDFLVVAGGGGAAFGGGGGGGFAEGLGSEGLSAQNFGDSTKVFVGREVRKGWSKRSRKGSIKTISYPASPGSQEPTNEQRSQAKAVRRRLALATFHPVSFIDLEGSSFG